MTKPYWLPIAIALLLFVGAIVNNYTFGFAWVDIWLTAILVLIAIAFSRVDRRQTVSPPKLEGQAYVRILLSVAVGAAVSHYAQAGVPLLSDDPNVARMEFMASSVAFKVLKVFVPFLIIYLVATLALQKKHRAENSIFTVILLILQLFSGGKGAALWGGVFVILGLNVAGVRLPVGKFILGAMIVAIPTVVLFKIVAGLDTWTETFELLLLRFTGIAEYGLYATVNLVRDDLRFFDPLLFVPDLFDKLTSSNPPPYTLSFGRRVTGILYDDDPYVFLWELTVTAPADIYTLVGGWIYPFAIIVYMSIFSWIGSLASRTRQLFLKTSAYVILYHLGLYVLTGSLMAEFFVRTVPFFVFSLGGWGVYCWAFRQRHGQIAEKVAANEVV
ncbi:hypothetical protein [Aquabacterium sp.]|uniref:hypothetical protein n=1 Tax=Aquabacterium sp. TaxID=1872578 RepID=UPI0025C6F3E9|nr:hypothetical protein [Aquabacterium sp.]